MSAKFTPGPWAFSKSDGYGDVMFYVSQADGAPYTPQYSDVATLLAETVSSERAAIQEANARLIAAAPCLLDACKAFIAYHETDDHDGISMMINYDDALKACRAAIAKAVQS